MGFTKLLWDLIRRRKWNNQAKCGKNKAGELSMNEQNNIEKKIVKLSSLPKNDPQRTVLANSTVSTAVTKYGSALKKLAKE